MINWAKLEVVDYLRSGALIVAFIAVLLSDKRGRNARGSGPNMWVNAEVVSFFVCGLGCYFFPTQFMEYYTRTSLSTGHRFWCQTLGCFLIGAAVTTARLQKSLETDPVVHYSWLVSRIVASTTLFAFLQKAHMDSDFFSDQNQSFVLLGVFLWMAGYLWQFFTMERTGGSGTTRSIGSPLNWYLLFFIVTGIMGYMVDLTNPRGALTFWTNIKPDAFMMHQLQAWCVLCIGLVLNFVGALFFSNDDDKKQFFFGSLVTLGLFMIVITLHQCKHDIFTQEANIIHFVAFFLFGGMHLRAYFLEPNKQKSR